MIDTLQFLLVYHLYALYIDNRIEQNIYFIYVNCTVSCQIHEYNNKFTNGHTICIQDITTKS